MKWGKLSPVIKTVLIGAAACAVIITIGQLPDQTNDAKVGTRKDPDPHGTSNTYVPPARRDDPTDCLKAGEICQLSGRVLDSLEWTPTSTSLEVHEELHKAIQADDKAGIAEMLQSGAVLDTKPGENIRILDVSVSSGWVEGRMSSGKHAGRKVWVARRFVKKPAGT